MANHYFTPEQIAIIEKQTKDSEVSDLEKRVENLEQNQDTDVSELENRVDEINAATAALEEKVKVLENTQTEADDPDWTEVK